MLIIIKYSACVIWLRKAYSMCVICSLYLKDLSQHLYLPGHVNIMINHQVLEICYSILFDQESEKTQKFVFVCKFPLLNKTHPM